MNTILLIIFIFITANFLIDRVLSWLNADKRRAIIPDELKDIYDEENYRKSIKYKLTYTKFEMFNASLVYIVLILTLYFEGFAYLDSKCRKITEDPILLPLLFFGIIMLLIEIFELPFEYYSTFVIEEKFKFNNTTPRIFIADKLKELLLNIIMGGLLLSAFIWFYEKTGKNFWWYLWLVYTAFSIFMSMFYSQLIVPLFNKQSPLPEGKLRDAIVQLAEKMRFKIKDIYVIDGSKRSKKANAYFTGLGHKKRIVLYDTLIEQLDTKEILAVLAHEIGHYKRKHTYIGLTLSVLKMGLTLYILSIFIQDATLREALGVYKPAIHISLVVFGILYSPIELILGLIGNIISRKHEYEADRYTASFQLGDSLISALKKLSKNNLSDINPHPAYVFFYYSHPPLLQRIRTIKNEEK